jgi:VWFA-related protein
MLSISTLAAPARGQGGQTQKQDDDVVRVTSELIQTGVTVFDKQGQFVDGLKAEQFELRVDGKPQPVSFFERVSAGSAGEEAVLRASRGAAPKGGANAGASVRGRTIIFFVDDMHLSLESLGRTRKVISSFVENEMSLNDQIIVASATGQIGFLQQFTDNKAVLRAALGRLVHKSFTVRDAETVQMTEYQALRIDQGDPDALNYYVAQLMRESSFKLPAGVTIGPPNGGPLGRKLPPSNTTAGLTREGAQRMVRERASLMLRQSSVVSLGTLTSLESLMRSSAQMPGRKLVFFFSDGFYLNDKETGFGDKLKRITDAASRAGIVVYSIDARGLVSMTDASSNRGDSSGQLSRANVGELSASQDPLTALAGDTGGRALLNTQALDSAVARALRETSNYYLLAWRPEPSEQRDAKFKRVEVSIPGRPELTVRLPRGFFNATPPDASKTNDKAAKPDAQGKASQPADAELRSALSSTAPESRISTLLSSTFIDTPNHGALLTNSVQVSTEDLDYGADGKQSAAVDIAGVVLNDQGKTAASFKTRLDVNPRPAASDATTPRSGVIYNHRTPLAPGIYQVRAASRDGRSGRVGSVKQWIEIPDIASRRLTLSSLLLGGQLVGGGEKKDGQAAGAEPQLQFSVDRRFSRASRLDFLMFIYNAARAGGGGTPDLTAQVQVFQDGRAVVNTPHRKLEMGGVADTARIPYGGGFPLKSLQAGRYELLITVNDRNAQTTAEVRTAFVVE